MNAQDRPNEVAAIRHQLDQMEGQFRNALPRHIPVERFARVVMTAIQANPELLECDRRSLWNAAIRAAQDGLLPDGREGAMIVRKSRNGKSANWQPMIAGIRRLARNSGEISTWDAHVVYDSDAFTYQLGDNPQINHTRDLRAEIGPIIGAYSVAILKDGSKSYEVMSIGEIHAIRDRSDAWKAFKSGYIKSTPWSTDEGEMARKTVARRHAKVLPMSTDLDEIVRRDDDDFGGKDEQEAIPIKRGRPNLMDSLDRLARGKEQRRLTRKRDAETDPESSDDSLVSEEKEPAAVSATPDGPADPSAPTGDAVAGSDIEDEGGVQEEISSDLKSLIGHAQKAASKGTKRLRFFFGKISEAEMDALEPYREELEEIAVDNDGGTT